MSSVSGGFSGDNALLAFAAMQQGRMNEELTESMRSADIRSQMAKDIASIKAHWDGANRDYAPDSDQKCVKPKGFIDLNEEINAFMEKYGDDPACADMMSSMGELSGTVKLHLEEWTAAVESAAVNSPLTLARNIAWIPKYSNDDVQKYLTLLQGTLDAAGTNDQLAMIHIKQLNDNINNSSGMVSGIMDSRQNTTASIINNIA
jgi:hypothetical protein